MPTKLAAEQVNYIKIHDICNFKGDNQLLFHFKSLVCVRAKLENCPGQWKQRVLCEEYYSITINEKQTAKLNRME